MIESGKKVSLFNNNVDLKDTSFSSCTNDNSTVVKLTHASHINTKKIEDGEIGVFGAEKYFKGAMDEKPPTTLNPINNPPNYHPKNPQEKDEEPPKPKTGSATPSIRSESSWNSRGALLGSGSNRRTHRTHKAKNGTVKTLLASLGCNCNDKASVTVPEKRVHVKEPVKPPTKSSDFADNKLITKREDHFTFPVLNSHLVAKHDKRKEEEEITRIKTRKNSLEVFGSPILEKGKKSFSLERKLTMLNWDGVTPKAENINMSKSGGSNDAASDASSDLFEIESFSTNGNNSFLARQISNGRSSNATLPNGYAPSEASIAWSVVTASVADFSILSDYDDSKTPKAYNMTVSRNIRLSADLERGSRGTGILSGCTSHKSVRVARDHVVVGGGDKGVGVITKERCHVDSITPIVKFQAERSRSPCASHPLYIQQ